MVRKIMKKNYIFLVGPMGSGKSTVGKLLAKQLKLAFADTDNYIEKACGTSINDIFKKEGEAFFRQKEKEIILQIPAGVVATGGGLPCYNSLMDILLANGIVFYLKPTPKQAMLRLSNAEDRPLLTIDNEQKAAKWEQLFNRREPIYAKAHFTIQADQKPNELVQQILNLL